MNPKSTRLHYLRGTRDKADPDGAPFLSPLHTSVSRPAVPTKLPNAPSFWTQTYLRKCYANASKYNFPHLLKIQITWMARQADGSHLAPGSDPMPSGTSGRGRKRLRMESKVTIGEGKAAFPPGGAEAARRAEGTCRGRFLSFPVPPSRPAPPPPLVAGLGSKPRVSPRLPAAGPSVGLHESVRFPPPSSSKGRAGRRRPFPGSPSDW